ncbi:predicted protein [Uncinocarpus reesii 1704]|uniref:Phosducin thioredoxin-like domain-containing protein n=1 Tax=Uncinocarpus reesii (strain UAMH 1704) TaxID=336963 RepID=C4JMT4_UNCRE|nr:uncharacterized protein UREG_04142 [Uncinocarpus reesii 1704]EEP79296.1 predicted protein [Uncinocarpus reesii 1704]
MSQSHPTNDDDTDALLDALENEDPNPTYTSQRIAQLKAELSSPNTTQSPSTNVVTTLLNNSPLPTLPTDQAVLDFTTQLTHCVVHFFHPDFSRCGTMDKHLTLLSTAHSASSGARFARADVRSVPFIVEKLKIRVLPCVIGFVDGEVREKVVGFEGLGPGGLDALGDDFETGVLEERLVQGGEVEGDESDEDEDREDARHDKKKTIRSAKRRGDDEDSDWD